MDLGPAVSAIVNAAAGAPATTGRPCRLKDSQAVGTLLQALLAGRSRTAAAKAAGISEGALRLWLKLAAGGDATYSPLLAAVEQIAEWRANPPQLAAQPAQLARPAAPAQPTRLVVPPALIHRWYAMLRQIEDLSGAWGREEEAKYLQIDVKDQMSAFGMSPHELPRGMVLPRLNLPANLPWDEVKRLYIEWCHATLRGGPTDMRLQPEASSWYREHRVQDAAPAAERSLSLCAK